MEVYCFFLFFFTVCVLPDAVFNPSFWCFEGFYRTAGRSKFPILRATVSQRIQFLEIYCFFDRLAVCVRSLLPRPPSPRHTRESQRSGGRASAGNNGIVPKTSVKKDKHVQQGPPRPPSYLPHSVRIFSIDLPNTFQSYPFQSMVSSSGPVALGPQAKSELKKGADY